MVTPCSLGLGCVTFGREIDQRASFDMMKRAVDRGIKIFDTAAAYAAGRSEEIVGKWLQLEGHVHEIAIGTKILPPYTPASIESSVDQSLARLRVSKIDILYLHRRDVAL